jgi:23S rRNA (guanosine2251-2'-O)-methyltransferase
MSEWTVLEGVVSVTATLEAGTRPVARIVVDAAKPREGFTRLVRLAQARGVTVERAGAEFFAAHAATHTHGGVIAFVGPRVYQPVVALVAGRTDPFVVMLDGFEDPYNFGHTVRALYAAGVDGLVVRPRVWTNATGIIVRSSAGASERLPTATTESPVAAIADLRRRGLMIACAADDRRAVPVDEVDLSGPLLMVIGGERRGLNRATLDAADNLVRIPYRRHFRASLGMTAAAAVLAFTAARQRERRTED